MLNLMRADLYRTRHRLYYFMLIGLPLGLILFALLFACLAIKPSPFRSGDGPAVLELIRSAYPTLGIWMTMMLGDLIFSEEYRHETMKNTLSYGFSRPKLYFSKLLTALLLGILAALILLAGSCGIIWFFMGGSAEEVGRIAEQMMQQRLYVLPLWTGFLSLALAIFFNVKSNLLCGLLYAVLVLFPGVILKLLGNLYPICGVIAQFLPDSLLKMVADMAWGPGALLLCWGVGLAFTVLTSGIGCALFCCREVK